MSLAIRPPSLLNSVYLKTLNDQQKFTLWMSLGIMGAALFYTAVIFPVVRDTSGLIEFIEQLPDVLLSFIGGAADITSPEGFLNADLFAVFAPVLFSVYAVIRGAGAIAGEEEARTLDQLLANPIGRKRLLLEKAAGVETGILLLSAVLYVSVMLGAAIGGYSVDAARLAQMVFSLFVLSSVSGMVALGIGAAFGARSIAGGITGGILLAGWLLNAVQALADVLEWTKFISLFWYYNGNQVLLNGLEWWRPAVMAGFAAAVLTAGALRFDRRDLHG